MDTTIFKKNYSLTINLGDCNEQLLMTSIIDLFQDTASKHANIISENDYFFNEKGLNWIITRSRVEFLLPVTVKQDVIVKTYQSNIGHASYNREYFLLDMNNNIIARGDAKWCVIDRCKNSIVPTKNIKNTNEICSIKAFDSEFIRFSLFEKYDFRFEYQVVYTDVDHNKHMNNAKYIKPLLDFFQNNIKKIEINYLKQSFLGDILSYNLKKVNEVCCFVYVYKADELINKCYIELFKKDE